MMINQPVPLDGSCDKQFPGNLARGAVACLIAFCGLALGGCLEGERTTAATTPATATAAISTPSTGTAQVNRAPSLSGNPITSVVAGQPYQFAPTAADADGNALTFRVQNAPAWATFNASNGTLSGTPGAGDIGTFSGIIISVSDGVTTTSLPAFAIAVTQIATGSATLSWVAPTLNTDGTALTGLTGYRIYFGTNATALTQWIDVPNASVSTYVLGNLSPATWYFAVKAMANGVESNFSNIATKTVT
ncbi:MAG: hypothetical protein RLZZ403_1950 [Pseudomonadota bacterium]|jgi:hypothetical protein